MKTYSYSRLSMFRQCPRRYFYRWVIKAKPIAIPQSIELFLGLRLHEAMKFLYQHHAAGLVPTVGEVAAEFHRRWRELWSDAISLGTKGHTADSVLAVGERAIRDFYARRQPFTDDRTVGLEQPVNVWLDAAGHARITGRLDRLSKSANGYVITDYKSGARLPAVQELESDDQLWLYALVVRQGFPPGQRVMLRWEFLRFDGETTLMPTDEQLENVRQRTLDIIAEIEAKPADADAFPFRTGPLCDSCPFQHVCPARRHLYEVRIMPECAPTMADAALLVDQWVDAETERTAAGRELHAIEERIEVIKTRLTLVAEQEGLARFFGSRGWGEVGVTVKDEMIPPRKTHEPDTSAALEKTLRASAWWQNVSALDRHALVRILNDDHGGDADLRALIAAASVPNRAIQLRLKVAKQPRRLPTPAPALPNTPPTPPPEPSHEETRP